MEAILTDSTFLKVVPGSQSKASLTTLHEAIRIKLNTQQSTDEEKNIPYLIKSQIPAVGVHKNAWRCWICGLQRQANRRQFHISPRTTTAPLGH